MDLPFDHRFFLLLSAPAVGSFLGVLIVRYPAFRPALVGRSSCPRCRHQLGLADLVPLGSWLFYRATCRYCGGKISWFYPGIEIAAILIAIWSVIVSPGWIAWASAGLGWTLLVLVVVDLRWYVLPRTLTLPLAGGGLLVGWVIDASTLLDNLAGLVVAVFFFFVIAWLYRRLRAREGLGGGDVWLLGALGAWVGWQGLPSVVLYACITALLWSASQMQFGRRIGIHTRLPFGPHLCAAGWLVWLYGPLQLG